MATQNHYTQSDPEKSLDLPSLLYLFYSVGWVHQFQAIQEQKDRIPRNNLIRISECSNRRDQMESFEISRKFRNTNPDFSFPSMTINKNVQD